MDFQSIESQMIVLFLAMAVGYLIRKLNIMNDSFDATLSRIVLDVTLPCLIVGSVVTADSLPDISTIGFIFALSIGANLLVIALGILVPILIRAPKKTRGIYSFMVSFGNVGFIGFPVVSEVFGPEAIVYASILNIPFNLLIFTVGVLFLSDSSLPFGQRLKTGLTNLKSPALISCLLVIVLAPLNVTHTGVIGDTLMLLGNVTTPAALLIIGSSMAKAPILTMIGNWRPYVAVAGRLVIAPLLVFAVFHFIVPDRFLLGIVVLTAGMPVATNGTLLCLHYGADFQTMLQGTFISTVLSIITIPLLALFIL